jgi:glutathione S-transferase
VRFAEHPWRQEYPALAALSDRLEARPSFAATAPVPQNIVEAVV